MCMKTNTQKLKPFVLKQSGESTSSECARSRRRERRTQQRQKSVNGNPTNSEKSDIDLQKPKNEKQSSHRKRSSKPNKSHDEGQNSDNTVSTASLSTLSVDSSSPKRPLHEKKSQKSKAKRSSQSKKGSRKCFQKKASKPVVVEIEELSEEEKLNYISIDCEMVGVGDKGQYSALARASIVNWYNDVLLDTYVKVDDTVTDYRTFVSGITPAHLDSDNAMEFEECRALVSSIIEGKVIVGHALKNDFDALRLSHPWYLIRDTAKFEPFMKPLDKSIKAYDPSNLVPKKLKSLAKDKLGMSIQEDGKAHDSIEDAIAAIELYKKARRKWEKAVQWKVDKTRKIEQSVRKD